MREALFRRQFAVRLLDDRCQIGAADRGLGVGVGDVVAELVSPVHRVDRHHHRVGAQDAVEGGRVLRAVLHVQRHAVARLDADALQPAGNRLGLRAQLGVAQALAEEDVGRLVRIAPGGDIEVEPQRGGRDAQLARQALGPMGMMGAVDGHGLSSGFRTASGVLQCSIPTESRQTRE